MANAAPVKQTLQFNPATNSFEYVDGPSYAQITISDPAKGIIVNSATKQWRLTLTDAGALVITEIVLQ